MCYWFHVVSSSFHPLLYVLPEAPIPYRKRRGPTRRIAAGSLVKLAGAFGSFSRHMFSFCTRMGCPRFAECVFGAYGYLGSKFFRQRTEASSTYLYREGWPLSGKCLGNRAGIGDFLRAGPTLLQADITRGHSKAATSQETNENRRITRIEELTIVPTLATYPRLVSFVSSGESDAPAATVWVLKRSDRGSVRRYMEKMTGLSRA